MTRVLIAIALSTIVAGSAHAQYMMRGGYGWGTYRYWGFNGHTGGYYNPGQYRWNGFTGWRHRNYY